VVFVIVLLLTQCPFCSGRVFRTLSMCPVYSDGAFCTVFGVYFTAVFDGGDEGFIGLLPI